MVVLLFKILSDIKETVEEIFQNISTKIFKDQGAMINFLMIAKIALDDFGLHGTPALLCKVGTICIYRLLR